LMLICTINVRRWAEDAASETWLRNGVGGSDDSAIVVVAG
jgi:hypothetical protein